MTGSVKRILKVAGVVCGIALPCGAAPVRVGILDFDKVDGAIVADQTFGDEGIHAALADQEGLEAAFVKSFGEDVLDAHDVLILPQTDPKLLPPDFKQVLKHWVEAGGGLLVTHDAVGYRRFGAGIFPNICGGTAHKPFSNKGIISREHPAVAGLEPRTVFEHSYYDHVVLSKGDNGTTVLREVRENEAAGVEEVGGPILIVGAAGKGRYAGSGVMFGWDRVTISDYRYAQGKDQETPPKGVEREILVRTVRWLAASAQAASVAVRAEVVKEGESLARLAAKEEGVEKPSPEEESEIARIKSRRVDIFPLPKNIEWGPQDILLAENGAARAVIVVDDKAGEKELLGAEEIAARCEALGSVRPMIRKAADLGALDLRERNVILIGTADSGLVQDYLQTFRNSFAGDDSLTRDSPGSQGYVVRSVTSDDGKRRVLLGGSDEQGTLYACYTFLYLMQGKGDRVSAAEANIRDWPDYGYRPCDKLYTFRIASGKPQFSFLERTRAYIDFLAKRKMNGVTLGRIRPEAGVQLHLRELSEYGRKRGVYVGMTSNSTWERGDRNVEHIRPECGVSAINGCCYGDDMMKRQADEITDFCRKYRPGLVSFHCPDHDPFHGCGREAGWWTKRCDVCRAKYKDDERWKADSALYKSMYGAVKAGCSETRVEFVLWPYHGAMITGDWPLWVGSEKRYQHYLEKVTAVLPDDVFIAFREASRPQTEAWDKHTNKHTKLVWYGTYNGFGRWVSSWGRDAATWWTGNRKDGFANYTNPLWLCYEISMLIGGQYGWNVKTPGYKVWDDRRALQAYNMTMKPTTEPPFVFETLVPLICRDIYGEQAGPYVEAALKTNMERGLPGTKGGWQHSRWEVDVAGKERAENGKMVDPLANYGQIRDEARVMYANMAEAMKVRPEDELRRWVVETLWYKAQELRCRGEGFYHWVLAAGHIEKETGQELRAASAAMDSSLHLAQEAGADDAVADLERDLVEEAEGQRTDRDKAQEELNLAVAYLDRERELMDEATERGYPASVGVMGYVPTGYGGAPYQKIRAWAQRNHLEVRGGAELKRLFEKVDKLPVLQPR